MTIPRYEIYALRYAHLGERVRGDNFIVADPHDAPMPIDYYVWLIRGNGRSWLVDTGFDEATAQQRQRRLMRCPIDSLSMLGVSAADVSDVIITHLHYDHAGNLGRLPNARLHLQELEMHYATGRHMAHDCLRHAYSVEHVVDLVRAVYQKRVEYYLGDDEIAPGVQLVHVGGHTQGLQSVRVHTRRGWVMLASDASHFYENMSLASPFPIVFNVSDMLTGHRRLLSLCEGPDHFIPGHDPLVLKRFPALPGSNGEVVCLHEAPITPLGAG